MRGLRGLMGGTMRRVSAAVLTQLLIPAKVVTDLVNKRAKDRGVELMKAMVNGHITCTECF